MPRFAVPHVKASPIIVVFICLAATIVAPSLARGEMRRIDSPRYAVHTDIRTTVAEEFAKRLDNIHDEYARRLAGFGELQREQAEVYLFERQEEFMAFTGGASPNV